VSITGLRFELQRPDCDGVARAHHSACDQRSIILTASARRSETGGSVGYAGQSDYRRSRPVRRL